MATLAARPADSLNPPSRIPAWLGDVVAVALIILAVVAPFPAELFRPTSAIGFVAALLPAVVLPFRRRLPIAVLVACVAAYGVAVFAGTLAPGVVIAIAVAMFGVAVRSQRRDTIVITAGMLVTIALLGVFAPVGSMLDPRAVQFVVMTAFAAAAGDATRSRREFIAAITERAVRAEESKESEAMRRVTEERLRIARDLHDAVAHQIAVISLNAGVASASLETRPDKVEASLKTIREAARLVLGEIGDVLEMLRTDSGDSPSAFTPQPGLERIDDLVAAFTESGLQVQLRVEGDVSRVSGATDLVAYRVVQEALTNALKHGAQPRAHVLIEVGEGFVRVVVTNPGAQPVVTLAATHSAALATTQPAAATGRGLIGLRERVASVRGTVETGFVGAGYRVVASLPLTTAGQA